MRELYISKVRPKPPCLIAKIKLEKSVQLEAQPLVWGTVYSASNSTDFSTFIFAIKQGGLEKTLEVEHSLIAQLVQDPQMI